MELSEDFREPNDNLIEVFSAREIVVVKRVAKNALAISTNLAEIDCSNSGILVVDFEENVDGNSSE